MTGLEQLRISLDRPDLTAEQADRLLRDVEGPRSTAFLRFNPLQESRSCQEIANLQSCSRGPVVKRCRVWLARAKALLEASE